MNSNKLYLLLGTACFAGYVWLYVNLSENFLKYDTLQICLVKNITTIPCPSCGTTRSMISMFQGDFIQAMLINPFGLLVAITMILTPIWIAFDVIAKKTTLFSLYGKLETRLKKPMVAIPLIILVIFNWIWNIIKGL